MGILSWWEIEIYILSVWKEMFKLSLRYFRDPSLSLGLTPALQPYITCSQYVVCMNLWSFLSAPSTTFSSMLRVPVHHREVHETIFLLCSILPLLLQQRENFYEWEINIYRELAADEQPRHSSTLYPLTFHFSSSISSRCCLLFFCSLLWTHSDDSEKRRPSNVTWIQAQLTQPFLIIFFCFFLFFVQQIKFSSTPLIILPSR